MEGTVGALNIGRACTGARDVEVQIVLECADRRMGARALPKRIPKLVPACEPCTSRSDSFRASAASCNSQIRPLIRRLSSVTCAIGMAFISEQGWQRLSCHKTDGGIEVKQQNHILHASQLQVLKFTRCLTSEPVNILDHRSTCGAHCMSVYMHTLAIACNQVCPWSTWGASALTTTHLLYSPTLMDELH